MRRLQQPNAFQQDQYLLIQTTKLCCFVRFEQPVGIRYTFEFLCLPPMLDSEVFSNGS